MRRVFVSYSRADLIHVLSIASALREAGLDTWIDIENLQPGERWKEAIEAALKHADAMIFCLSPLSIESAWTSVELNLALEQGVNVIPLMIQRVNPALLPHSIRERQILDMEMWPAEVASALAARAILAAMGVGPVLPTDHHTCGSDPFRTILVSLGQRAALKEELLDLSATDAELRQARHWHIRTMRPSLLAEILAQTRFATRAIITVDEHADPPVVNILIGAIAALLGEWRVTVVEGAGASIFKQSAALSRARHVSQARAMRWVNEDCV